MLASSGILGDPNGSCDDDGSYIVCDCHHTAVPRAVAFYEDNRGGRQPIECGTVSEPATIAEPLRETRMEISLPRLCVGFKDNDVGYSGRKLLVREQTTSILLEILFGHASPLFESLYESQLVDEGFSAMYSGSVDCGYSMIAGETPDPAALEARIREELERARKEGIDPADFERQKRATMGHFFRQFNSLDHIANYFCSYKFADIDLFDLIDVLHQLDHTQVEARLREHLSDDGLAKSVLWPLNEDSPAAERSPNS